MRIGIVGTSYWAKGVHGAAAAAAEDWELTTVYGRSSDKAKALAEELGCASTTDVEELLDRVDALAFAVPPDVQAPLALSAAKAGKHLLLEKPLALDVPSARDLSDAITASGVAALVFFTRLWVPQTVGWLDAVRDRGGWQVGRVEHLVGLPAELLGSSPWRVEHGALWDVGPHCLSMLERVLGPVTAVFAQQGPRDHVDLVFQHGEGATSSAALSLTTPEGTDRKEVLFLGTEGTARPEESDLPFPAPTASAAALSELARQVRTGDRGGVDAGYGLHVVEVLAAAQRSLTSGGSEPV